MASLFAIPAIWPINEFFAFHQDARCDRHDRRGHCPENLEKQICGQSLLGDFGGIAFAA